MQGKVLAVSGFSLLPPASEGWGKVIFSVCSHLGGGGVPHLRSGVGRYPISGGGGVPHLRSEVGGYPGQVWMVGRGYPIPGLGWGVPQPGLDGGYPPSYPVMGYPPDLRWGTPQPEMGYPWHTPPPTDQHSEHLPRGGRYAFCVHSGGLSCCQ